MELNIRRLLNKGESGLSFVKSMGIPLGIAKTACSLGSAFSSTSKMSQKVLERVNLAFGPSDFASLALDTLEFARSIHLQKIPVARISQLAFSILKRSCDMLAWLQQYSLIAFEPSVMRRLEAVAIPSGLMKDLLRLWQEWGPNPPSDRDLIVSIPKVLKSSLLFYAYVADDKRFKVITIGLGLIGDGYSLYRQCESIDPNTWNITREQAYNIITSIALASLAYYLLEDRYFGNRSA